MPALRLCERSEAIQNVPPVTPGLLRCARKDGQRCKEPVPKPLVLVGVAMVFMARLNPLHVAEGR